MTYSGGSQESGYPIPQTDALFDLELQLERDFSVKAGQRQSNTIAGHETIGTGALQWETLKADFAPDLGDLPHAEPAPTPPNHSVQDGPAVPVPPDPDAQTDPRHRPQSCPTLRRPTRSEVRPSSPSRP